MMTVSVGVNHTYMLIYLAQIKLCITEMIERFIVCSVKRNFVIQLDDDFRSN